MFEIKEQYNTQGAIMKKINAIARQITVLRAKRAKLMEEFHKNKMAGIAKMFLESKWTLNDRFQLTTKNTLLAKNLTELNECGDFDYDDSLTVLFGDKSPYTEIDSYTIETTYDRNDAETKLTGIIRCDTIPTRLLEMGKLINIRPALERMLPHFKNLKIGLQEITWKISEANLELVALTKTLRAFNKANEQA